jgi:hypothetical protein
MIKNNFHYNGNITTSPATSTEVLKIYIYIKTPAGEV